MNLVALSEGSIATSMRCTRWRQFLAEFDYAIRHIAGIKNITADYLSRPSLFIPPHQAGDGIAVIQAAMYESEEEEDEVASKVDQMIFAIAEGPRNIYECIHMVHNSRTGHQGVQATWLACKKTFPNAPISYEAVNRQYKIAASAQKSGITQSRITRLPEHYQLITPMQLPMWTSSPL
jgi:hypothetical protein